MSVQLRVTKCRLTPEESADVMLPLARSLAHLYHYYLHGEQGNRGGREKSPGDAPSISLECSIGSQHTWQCDLASVSDDLESLYLQVSNSQA